MKPREFDELVRQKFDRNDFEYNPANWDKLEEKLDGKAKKRSIMMWWLMPVAGIAASVAMAVGVAPMFYKVPVNQGPAGEFAQTLRTEYVQPAQEAPVVSNVVTPRTIQYTRAAKNIRKQTGSQPATTTKEKFAISYQNAIGNIPAARKQDINLLNAHSPEMAKKKENNKVAQDSDPIATFKPEEVRKPAKMSIIITGGYSHGNQNAGYAAGATIRRKINEKVFIEGEVAFASSNIAQGMPYRDEISQTHYWQDGHEIMPPANTAGARTTNIGEQAHKITTTTTIGYGPTKSNNVTYDLSYIQVSPSLGYKLMKRVSLGLGPDFQQALADNRPTPSETNPGTNQRAPLFDVGMVGRTEYSITRNIKAGVAYRKGINNLLTPMGKYIDRDYLQFQVKCAIFNK